MLVALALAAAAAPIDPKAADAVSIFSDLCVSMFTGTASDVDQTRFAVTELGKETARQVKPESRADHIWDVSGKTSNVHTLVHYEPTGLCVVEVADANEADIRTAFAQLVGDTATKLKSAAERQPDQVHQLDGKPATSSMWRLHAKDSDIALAETTYPDPKYMIQHLFTVSRVK